LLIAVTAPAGVRAHEDTQTLSLSTAVGALVPGLCFAGDLPTCAGPSQPVQARILSLTCSTSGVFEGLAFQQAECQFELYGFLTPLPGRPKPMCGGAVFETSDLTTAWGPGKVSTTTTSGVTRRMSMISYDVGGVLAFSGWIDDADADDDPAGDHALTGAGRGSAVREGFSIPCTTTPVRTIEIIGVELVQ
jgi:hypothetical protein